MPERPEPVSNLGMVYEAVGKFDKAIEMYQMAYEMDPRNPQIIGNFARSRMRRGDSVDDVRSLLQELVFFDTRPDWVRWAREHLAFHPTPRQPSTVEQQESNPERLPPTDSESLPLPQNLDVGEHLPMPKEDADDMDLPIQLVPPQVSGDAPIPRQSQDLASNPVRDGS